MHMKLNDSRRLTGLNPYWEYPSAIIDVVIEGPQALVVNAWQSAAKEWLEHVGYADEKTLFRLYEGGASLLISSPIDVMYSMCELNELAWASALAAVGEGEAPDPAEEIPRLHRLFDEERNPALLSLQEAARALGVPFLWDDDSVSLGYGKTTRVWKPDELPPAEVIDWSAFQSVPLALVTGTNGKSTTVRMTAAIMSAAGYTTGLTSTDFIRVGQRVIAKGDYSGTGGARLLMRQPDVEMAVLEVARGGLLRRGLGVGHADVAVVTNVAADHLGEYGINSVQELIPVKLAVRRALSETAPLVLNADDPGLVEFAETTEQRIIWFSLDSGHEKIQHALSVGELACYLQEDWLVAIEKGKQRKVVSVSEIPAAMHGIARHNLSNALAAMCTSLALGISDAAIRKGLAVFRGDEHDNPGRGNWFERKVDGGFVRILVDFAHNEHGMKALAAAVGQVDADRIILLIGQAGDRSDQDIKDLLRAACSTRPDRLLVADLPGYERGRAPFEVVELIAREAVLLGVPADAVEIFSSPRAATAAALSDAQAGDLLVLLTLTQRAEALALIHAYLEDGETGG